MSIRFVFVRSFAPLTLLILLCLSLQPADSFAKQDTADDLSVTFDWSMPTRFGLDENQDGLVDYFTTTAAINPSGWVVNFNACDTTTSHTITSYFWEIADTTGDPNPPPTEQTQCDTFAHTFPKEGSFLVTLTVTTNHGQTATLTRHVVVQDWLIVSFGDSYASGEGVPDIPLSQSYLNDLANLETNIAQIEDDLAEKLAELVIAQADYDAALEALEDAEQELEEAATALTAAQLNFNQTKAAADNVSDICVNPLRFFDCLEALSNFLGQVFNDIPAGWQTLVDEVVNTAKAALNVAEAAFDLATQVFEETEEEFENIVAVVDALVQAATDLEAALEDAANDLTNLELQARVVWQDEGCHRSAEAGPAQAALQIENQDAKTSVTFVHLACSGGKVSDVLNQVSEARTLIGEREIDAVIISVGGNDVAFANLIKTCLKQEPCHTEGFTVDPRPLEVILCGEQYLPYLNLGLISTACADTVAQVADEINTLTNNMSNGAAEIFAQKIVDLPAGYASLNGVVTDEVSATYRALNKQLNGLTKPNQVYITEYPDLTGNDAGGFCSNVLLTITAQEVIWAGGTAGPGLNQAVSQAAADYGWVLVDGIFSGSRNHGYCADDRWMVRLEESLLTQLDINGIMHPNRAGHQFYAEHIAAKLTLDFYPNGKANTPREPTIEGQYDADQDGLLNEVECPDLTNCSDFDEDGLPNYLDPDDDGDGIPTIHERGDANNNNIPDYLERIYYNYIPLVNE